MPARRLTTRPARHPQPVLASVPAFVEGFYWYTPLPGDPLYDPIGAHQGAEVVHLTPLAAGRCVAWFAGNPTAYEVGTLGYLPVQFRGPLSPPDRGVADVQPSP